MTPQKEVPTQIRQANDTSAVPPPTAMPGPSSNRKKGETWLAALISTPMRTNSGITPNVPMFWLLM
jgi:hypothetical protein